MVEAQLESPGRTSAKAEPERERARRKSPRGGNTDQIEDPDPGSRALHSSREGRQGRSLSRRVRVGTYFNGVSMTVLWE